MKQRAHMHHAKCAYSSESETFVLKVFDSLGVFSFLVLLSLSTVLAESDSCLSAETVTQNNIIQTPNNFRQGLSMFDIRQRFIERLLALLSLPSNLRLGYTLAKCRPRTEDRVVLHAHVEGAM